MHSNITSFIFFVVLLGASALSDEPTETSNVCAVVNGKLDFDAALKLDLDTPEAVECLTLAANQNPTRYEGWQKLSIYYLSEEKNKDFVKGKDALGKLAELVPSEEVLSYYATVCRISRDDENAIKTYQKILLLNPNNLHAMAQLAYAANNLGGAHSHLVNEHLLKLGEILLKTPPPVDDQYQSYFIDALKHFQTGHRWDKLVYFTEKAIAANIFPKAESNLRVYLGIGYNGEQQYTKALQEFGKVSLEQLDSIQAFELGKIYVNLGKMEQAAKQFAFAVDRSPENPVAHYSYALTLRFLGMHAPAFLHAERAYQIDSSNSAFYGEFLHLLKALCLWRRFETEYSTVKRAIDAGDLNYLETFRTSALYWGWSMKLLHSLTQISVTAETQGVQLLPQRKPDPLQTNRRLKIGYVSSNYRNHAQGTQMSSFFMEHDRKNFEIWAISTLEAVTKEALERRDIIKKQVDHFVEVEQLNKFEIAKKIHELGIDIMIDLCGHADHPKLPAFAYRPAPVQISFLGYPGTTGADFMDYYIGDETSTPPSMARHFSEKLIYMPHTYQITEHRRDYPVSETDSENFAEDSPIIFANFNQPTKIGLPEFTVWMNLLKRTPSTSTEPTKPFLTCRLGVFPLLDDLKPFSQAFLVVSSNAFALSSCFNDIDSVMWLLEMASKEGILNEAKAQGVDPSRLVFQRSIPKASHMERMKKAHLLLDNLHYNAHTSAGDALWAGLPIVTLPGDVMQSRVCASIIKAAGPEFAEKMIAKNLKDYEEKAYALVTNLPELKALKKKLLESRLVSPLFDTAKFARDFEAGLRETWRIFNAGENPKSFRISDLKR